MGKELIDYGQSGNMNPTFPDQFVSAKKKKTKEWQEANAYYFKNLVSSDLNNGKRKSLRERHLLWRMFNGELSASDIIEIYDPMGVNVHGEYLPETAISYNVIKTPLTVLIGEELRRKTDVRCVALNPEVINQKDLEYQEKALAYFNQLQQQVQQGYKLNEDQVKKELENLDYYVKYDQQSAHELLGNETLSYLYNDPYIRIRNVFSKGWQEKVVTGESIYRIGAIGKEPRVFNVNPDNFIVMGMGDSDLIEDGTAWIEWEYMPLPKIQEEFYKEIKPATLTKIREQVNTFRGEGMFQLQYVPLDKNQEALSSDNPLLSLQGVVPVDGMYRTSIDNTDANGNILVLRFQWLSAIKIGLLTYFDANDIPQTEYVSEEYKIRGDRGETVEWLWADELMEGVMIGDELIYCRPAKVQMRSLLNPSMVRPCYVGSVVAYGVNGKASSLLDAVIPYSRDYDLYANKLRKMWANYIGNILRIDKARKSKDLTDEQYLSTLRDVGISFEDSTNLADDQITRVGNMQSYNPVAQMSMSNDIKETIGMLNYLKNEIKNVLSLPDTRTGQIEGSVGLGVSQQSAIQATTATEYMTRLHDEDKTRVAAVFLEYLKHLWKGENIKKQVLLSDLSSFILDYDSDLMLESELGVVMTNGTDMEVLMQRLMPSVQAFAQNGMIGFSDIVNMEFAKSASELKRMMESAQEKTRKAQEEANARAEEEKRKTLAYQEELNDKAFQREVELLRLKYQFEAEADLQARSMEFANEVMADENGDGVVDDIEIKKAEIAKEAKMVEIQSKERMHSQDVRLKEQELRIKAQQAKSKTK